MKISEPQLHKIYYSAKFETLYTLIDDIPLVLNDNLKVYTIKDDEIQNNVDFKIFTDDKGIRYISPMFNVLYCDGFLLVGERLGMCKTVEIKADEYITKTERDGNFTFTIEAKEYG